MPTTTTLESTLSQNTKKIMEVVYTEAWLSCTYIIYSVVVLVATYLYTETCSYIGEPFRYHDEEVLSLQPMFPPKPLDTLPLEVDAQKV